MYSKRIQEKVKEDYEEIAKSFSDTRRFPWKDFECFLPYYEKNFTVLDLGCGNGRLLKFLKKHGFKSYLGVDQVEGLLELAKAEHGGSKVKFLLADMSDLTGLDCKFDAIFAIASFHHLPPKDQLKTLKKWRKLLKNDGFLFMTNWNLHQPKFWPAFFGSFFFPKYGFRGVSVSWQNRVRRYYYAFTKRRLAFLLKKAGFGLILKNDYVKNGEDASLLSAKNILTIVQSENSERPG